MMPIALHHELKKFGIDPCVSCREIFNNNDYKNTVSKKYLSYAAILLFIVAPLLALSLISIILFPYIDFNQVQSSAYFLDKLTKGLLKGLILCSLFGLVACLYYSIAEGIALGVTFSMAFSLVGALFISKFSIGLTLAAVLGASFGVVLSTIMSVIYGLAECEVDNELLDVKKSRKIYFTMGVTLSVAISIGILMLTFFFTFTEMFQFGKVEAGFALFFILVSSLPFFVLGLKKSLKIYFSMGVALGVVSLIDIRIYTSFVNFIYVFIYYIEIVVFFSLFIILFCLAVSVAVILTLRFAYNMAYIVVNNIKKGFARLAVFGFTLGAFLGLAHGIVFGFTLNDTKELTLNLSNGILTSVIFAIIFPLFYLRIIFWPIETVLSLRGKIPLKWHHMSCFPIPGLEKNILNLASIGHSEEVKSILNTCSYSPGQRKIGERVLAQLQILELESMVENRDWESISLLSGEWLQGPENSEGFLKAFAGLVRDLEAAFLSETPSVFTDTMLRVGQQLEELKQEHSLGNDLTAQYAKQLTEKIAGIVADKKSLIG